MLSVEMPWAPSLPWQRDWLATSSLGASDSGLKSQVLKEDPVLIRDSDFKAAAAQGPVWELGFILIAPGAPLASGLFWSHDQEDHVSWGLGRYGPSLSPWT